MNCSHCNDTKIVTWPSEDGGSPPMVCPWCVKLRMVECANCNGHGSYAVNSGGPDGEEYIPCDKCEGKGRYPEIYCHACSQGGGADRAIYHDPPACSIHK